MTPKVLLSGNYDASGLMNDNLRAAGIIPTTEPYSAIVSNLVNCSCDSTTQAVLDVTGNDAIVDWVLVELREKTNKDNILQSVTALLQKDGDIVDVDGISPIKIPNLSVDSFYVAVKHRNHAGVLSNAYMELTPISFNYDFTTDVNNTFGTTNGIGSTGDGRFALFGGDVNMNGQIQNTDRSALILQLATSGYKQEDIDLNGQVQNSELNDLLIPNLAKGAQFGY